jgi:hypothetical protein
MGFPITKTKVLDFGVVGLTPAFQVFKRVDTLLNVTPPAITEIGSGLYKIDYVFNTSADPDVLFLVNGNAPGAIDDSWARFDTISSLQAPAAFPATKRYFEFLGLFRAASTPAIAVMKRADTYANITSIPVMSASVNGIFYFDYVFQTAGDPETLYVINPDAPAALGPSRIFRSLSLGDYIGSIAGSPQITSAVLSGSNITVTFQAQVVQGPALLDARNWSILRPATAAPVIVNSVRWVDAFHVILSVNPGTPTDEGTYSVSLAPHSVNDLLTGTDNPGALAATYLTVPTVLLAVVSSKVTGANTIQVTYNKRVQEVSASGPNDALNPGNYIVYDPTTGTPVSVQAVAPVSGYTVALTTTSQLPIQYKVQVINVKDLQGNIIT